MSNAAHTPGPWQIAEIFAQHGLTMNDGAIPIMAGDERVVLVDYRGDASPRKRYKAASPERDANARLIVAAPDSHEANRISLMALCVLLEHIKTAGGKPLDPDTAKDVAFAIEANRAAIAKAKGAA